jgi:hypothetical protein
VWIAACLACAAFPAQSLAEGPLELRLRVQFGGGQARVWNGTISVEGGWVERFTLLGPLPDEAASLWIDQGQLQVSAVTSRNYEGVDILVTGPPDADFVIALDDREAPGSVKPIRVPLRDLVTKVMELGLDDAGNWIQVRRAPGDRLRVRLDRTHPFFAPGEVLAVEFRPVLLDIKPGTELDVEMTLERARGGGVVQTLPVVKRRIEAGATLLGTAEIAGIPGEFIVPAEEGVYEVVCKLSTRRWNLHPRLGGNWLSEVVEQRRMQIVVMAQELGPADSVHLPEDDATAPIVTRIDPAHPGWRQQLGRFTLIPGWNRGPLGAGEAQVLPYDARREGRGRLWQLMQLGQGPALGEPAWQGFPLKITRLGEPHLLEIDYPQDMPQTLGVSILDPATDTRSPVRTLSTGVDLPAQASLEGAGLATHRVLFWPQSPNPLVLVSNQRRNEYAVFGEIRVRRIEKPLRPPSVTAPSPGRLAGTWLRDAKFPESLLADQPYDSQTGRAAHDWQTFHRASERLVGTLHHRRQNLLMVTVAADGHTLFPSEQWRSGTRFDSGTLATDIAEPMQRDVLELLYRQFDRHPDLWLLPVLRFDGPLPAVEDLARRQDGSQIGLDLIGPDGRPWRVVPERQTPLYNPLDERVQDAMVAAVREMAFRCGTHPSMMGIGIELAPDCFTQLPGVGWGLDDRTVARFAEETRSVVPGDGPERHLQRAEALAQEPLRRTWLLWRATQLAKLFHRMQHELRQIRPEARLILLPPRMWTGTEGQRSLRQSIPQGVQMSEALLPLGLLPQQYEGPDAPWLARPYTLSAAADRPLGPLTSAIDHSGELDFEFARGRAGTVLFDRPTRRIRMPSFEAQDPFTSGPIDFAMQVTPSGAWERQPVAQALAVHDPLLLIESGDQFSAGDLTNIRPLWSLFRELPPQLFRPLPDVPQPVIARMLSTDRETYIYAVNDSPWRTTLRMEVGAPASCTARRLGSQDAIDWKPKDATWTVTLEPFEVVGAVFDQPQVRFRATGVDIPDHVPGELQRQVNELADRVAALRPTDPETGTVPVTIWNLQDRLTNAGFETPAQDGQPTGWIANVQSGVSVEYLPERPHLGQASCRLTSTGPIATLASPTFTPPKTGVVLMAVWVRTSGGPPPSTLRLAVEATLDGKPYYRFAPLGGEPGNPQLGPRWHRYLVSFYDLPLSGLRDMRMRLDLMGPGEVWIDDVQLSSVLVTEPELVQLRKTIATARFALGARRWGDVRRLLAGFWPRQLADEVSMAQTHLVPAAPETPTTPPAAVPAAPSTPQTTSTWYDRLWFWR